MAAPRTFETFDPKPDAPVEFRGEFTHTKTAVPGALFSEHMVKLAASLDDFAMIRSIRHNQGNHGAGNHYMMTGVSTAHSGWLRGIRQLSPQPWFRCR